MLIWSSQVKFLNHCNCELCNSFIYVLCVHFWQDEDYLFVFLLGGGGYGCDGCVTVLSALFSLGLDLLDLEVSCSWTCNVFPSGSCQVSVPVQCRDTLPHPHIQASVSDPDHLETCRSKNRHIRVKKQYTTQRKKRTDFLPSVCKVSPVGHYSPA